MSRNGQIKHNLLALAFVFFSCLILGLASCATNPGGETNSGIEAPSFSVYLYGLGDQFAVESSNPASVKRGENAVFTVKVNEQFAIDGLFRDNERIEYLSEALSGGKAELVIPDIHYSQLIEVRCSAALATIDYYPNGASYRQGGDAEAPFTVRHTLRNRLRPNTELGTNVLVHDGYYLRGWNTSPDGSGEEIGLGSRVTVARLQPLSLYAHWEQESPKTDFTYSTVEGGIEITHYSGPSKAVVPLSIDGSPVVSIAESAFNGEEEQVFLPQTIKSMKKGAFSGSKIKELWLYDNMQSIGDACFVSCPDFKTVHINAVEPPRFGGSNLYSEYNLPDKYDLLILHKDERKLIAFGGSGTYISVNTKLMESEFSGYVCLNMAVNGWFNAIAQIEMMLPYLKSGDVFLHIPESSSQFGLFYGDTMIPATGGFDYNKLRLYSALESNYDLFGLVDLRHVSDFFDGLSAFNAYRLPLPATTYDDYKTDVTTHGISYRNDLGYIDDRGNWALPRPAGADPTQEGEADAVVEYLDNDEARERAVLVVDAIETKGAAFYLATAAVNEDTLQMRLDHPELFDAANPDGYLYFGRPEGIPDPNYPSLADWVHEFDEKLNENFKDHVIMGLSETLFTSKDYFEPDYHLSDEAVPVFTNRLVSALKNKIGGGFA